MDLIHGARGQPPLKLRLTKHGVWGKSVICANLRDLCETLAFLLLFLLNLTEYPHNIPSPYLGNFGF